MKSCDAIEFCLLEKKIDRHKSIFRKDTNMDMCCADHQYYTEVETVVPYHYSFFFFIK